MIPKNYYRRLLALESAANTPLRRAEDNARRGVPVEAWSTEELEAFCATHCRDLAHLSDDALAAIVAAEEGDRVS